MIPGLLVGAGLGAGLMYWLDTRKRGASRHVSDETIADQIRAELALSLERPRAIAVEVQEGVVTLSGQVLDREVDNVLHAAESIRGVQRVENRLAVLVDERRAKSGPGG